MVQNSAPFTFSSLILHELGVTILGIFEWINKTGIRDSTRKIFYSPGNQNPRKSHPYLAGIRSGVRPPKAEVCSCVDFCLLLFGFGPSSSLSKHFHRVTVLAMALDNFFDHFWNFSISTLRIWNMWQDQEEWVGCWRCCFWDIGKNSVQILLCCF